MQRRDWPGLQGNKRLLRCALVAGFILIAALARLLPHPPNFTPLGAIALFAGATFASRTWSLAVPLLAMALSDLVIGSHTLMPVVYGCLLVNVALGRWLRNRIRPLRVAGATLAGSVFFFVVTNLACWWSFYEPTVAGLGACFVAAIPFFGNTLLGDAVFSTVLFGALAFSQWRFPVLRPVPHSAPA